MHVINVDIIDNHEQALVGGQLILRLVLAIKACKNIDSDLEKLVEDFETKTKASMLYCLTIM